MFSGLYEDIKTTFVNTMTGREDIHTAPQVFDDYQKRVIIGFDNSTLKLRNDTISSALDHGNHHGKLHVGTRDLYLKAGEVESYDFCNELPDSTLAPYNMGCLQKEFLRVGGQKTGHLYPSAQTMPQWNTLKKWLYVKQYIQNLILDSKSQDPTVSKRTNLNLYGPNFEYPMTLESFMGVEVFWFSNSADITRPTIFLGRRIRNSIPYFERDGMNSVVFFTSIIVKNNSAAQFLVTTNNAFALYFNNSMSAVYNNKMVSTASEMSMFQKMGPISRKSSIVYLLAGHNTLSGYIFQDTGHYYKMEIHCSEISNVYTQIPSVNLNLTQEPFAPMVSFEVEPLHLNYGCDYTFCDKRMGGFKMKWGNDGWGGPSRYYRGDSRDRLEFPLLKSYIRFPKGGTAIQSKFYFKLHSFMTLTLLIKFKEFPDKGIIATPLIFYGLPGYYPAIRLTTIKPGFANINIGTSMDKIPVGIPLPSTDGPTIQLGIPYLIIIRMLRKNEQDPGSLNAMQIGAGKLWDLQESYKYLNESTPIVYTNVLHLDNPDSQESKSLFYIQSKACTFDLYWMHLFDYNLKEKDIEREANANWRYSI